MRFRIVAAACALALSSGGHAAAGDMQLSAKDQIAYFQEKNIFHSGLRDTHTIALTFDDGPNQNTPPRCWMH